MSRHIIVLALIQFLLVVLGFFGLGIVMKLDGYPAEIGIYWTPLALHLRQHGLFLVFVPVVWSVFTALAQNRERLIFSLGEWLYLGIALAVAMISLFLYASVFPCTVPLVMGR